MPGSLVMTIKGLFVGVNISIRNKEKPSEARKQSFFCCCEYQFLNFSLRRLQTIFILIPMYKYICTFYVIGSYECKYLHYFFDAVSLVNVFNTDITLIIHI